MDVRLEVNLQVQATKKVVSTHGFDFNGMDYSLYSILVLKAMMAGNEKPYEWARKQLDNLNQDLLE